MGAQLPVIKVQAHGPPDEETNTRANQRALTTQAAAASCLEACDTVAGRARHRGSPGDPEAEGGSVERLNGPHLLLNGRISRDGRNGDVESDRRLLRAAGAGSEKNARPAISPRLGPALAWASVDAANGGSLLVHRRQCPVAVRLAACEEGPRNPELGPRTIAVLHQREKRLIPRPRRPGIA